MKQTKPQLDQKIILDIERLGINGEGVAHLEGYTLFVDGALPGENVLAQVQEAKKTYGKAALLEVKSASKNRVTPVCPHFGTCGGCQLMHLKYDKQLEAKTARVTDALERIGKLTVSVSPCIASPNPLYYRNKVQVPIRADADNKIGFYKIRSHDLVSINTCHIHCPIGQKVFDFFKNAVNTDPVSFENVRHLVLKTAVKTGQVLAILVTNNVANKKLILQAKKVMKQIPEVKGVVQNINRSSGNVVLGSDFITLVGQGSIEETICDLRFSVSPASFFQVNPMQAENLYQTALAFAELSGDETVIDAFCGVGTLSLIFAKHVKQVIGVECVLQAVEDAKHNAELNGIKNTTFYLDKTERFLSSKKLNAVDLVILNPPRKGCDEAVLDAICQSQPKKLIYISCDPATLARDLNKLCGGGYRIQAVQPFDMFPQTAHVETLVSLYHETNL